MQPPIPVGTVLQNRYKVLSILGQGGFGRTYLAEDQGRFNECCALKEFIPPQGSDYTLNKSKELFQREAAILYQIQHPQIPQFRATFEENHRLFLVQDYVDGKTYRMLLNERKAQGSRFSETEVLSLIQNLLPVLAHIHGKGIIHRDIAPDNIILRRSDNLPILIDFGVVKEIVTRFHQSLESLETVSPTTVGKLGYAPSEQIQTGRAYPSSDLYALAVTAVVLLTGREPHELYDDHTLTWQWQQWTNVNPDFAAILNRMLSYRPGDRYTSAVEVIQALQPMAGPATVIQASIPPTPAPVAPPTPAPPPTPLPPRPAASATPDVSQMQTIAIGRRPEPTTSRTVSVPQQNRRQAPPPVIRPSSDASIWDNPLAVLGIGLGLATVTGIAAWAIVSAVLNSSQPTPIESPTPTPIVSPTASPSPSPTTAPSPVEYSQRLDLPATGELRVLQGHLKANETVTYVITAEQNQTFNAALEGEGVLLTVLSPNQQPVGDRADRVLAWQGDLPFTGDYAVRLSPVKGIAESDFKLNLSLQAAPAPSPSPSPSASPSPAEPRVEAAPLSPTLGEPLIVPGRSDETIIKRYLVNVASGQILSAAILDGTAVTLNIRYPNGQLVENASMINNWQAQITEPGEYQIDVIAPQVTNFTLRVLVKEPTDPLAGGNGN